jgi:hypothetical protein
MMKRIDIFLIAALAGLCSCAENERESFREETVALNIWFGNSAVNLDSLVYNYAYRALDADVDSVMFRARLIGVPVDADRPFKLRVAGGGNGVQEGVHFLLGDYRLPAGAMEAEFPIYLTRTSDFRGTPDHPVELELDVTGSFATGAREFSRLKLVLKDREEKPENWDEDSWPYFDLSYFFGPYSRVKHQFIITVTGLVIFKVLYQGTPAANEISFFEAQYLQRKCRAELAAYNAEHPGDPLKDENGEPIVF